MILLAITNFFRFIISAVVIASMAVALTISFAVLVYSGPLHGYLGEGLTVTLVGAMIMSVVGAFLFSFVGTICHPQDITAVLIGGAAATIASNLGVSGNSTFPTIVAFAAVTSFATGVFILAAGKLRLGSLVRYLPYTVISGFLGATGYLLVLGALTILFRENVNLYNLPSLLLSHSPISWLPWISGGFLLSILMQRVKSDLTLPLTICASVVLFFLSLYVLDISIEQARSSGLLLGPFDQTAFSFDSIGSGLSIVEWSEIASQAPTIVAVAALTIIGTMLNSSGLTATLDAKIDFDRDLKATGLANIASSSVGGLPGFVILGETLLANRLGLRSYLPAIIVTLAFGSVLVVGTEILSYLPAGLFGLLISYLGFDLLGVWLLGSRKRLSSFDYMIVLLIVGVAAAYSFLAALGVGIVAAIGIFIYSYSTIETIRIRSTVSQLRSRVERSAEASRLLSEKGSEAIVLQLSGFIFFGTADRLAERVSQELETNPQTRFLILDFKRVSGIDASARVSLRKIIKDTTNANVKLMLASIPDAEKYQIDASIEEYGLASAQDSLDAAIEFVEEELLAENGFADLNKGAELKAVIAKLKKEFKNQPEAIQEIEIGSDEKLLCNGDASNEIYVLEKGTLRAEIENANGRRIRVAEFQPYALVGEIAFYAQVPRTAWVIANGRCRLLKLDLDAIDRKVSRSVMEFHKIAARSLSRRVIRMTELNLDADI